MKNEKSPGMVPIKKHEPALVVYKRSAYLPSTPTIKVLSLLNRNHVFEFIEWKDAVVGPLTTNMVDGMMGFLCLQHNCYLETIRTSMQQTLDNKCFKAALNYHLDKTLHCSWTVVHFEAENVPSLLNLNQKLIPT